MIKDVRNFSAILDPSPLSANVRRALPPDVRIFFKTKFWLKTKARQWTSFVMNKLYIIIHLLTLFNLHYLFSALQCNLISVLFIISLCQILTVFIKIYIEFCGKSPKFCRRPHFSKPSPPRSLLTNTPPLLCGRPLWTVPIKGFLKAKRTNKGVLYTMCRAQRYLAIKTLGDRTL